MSTYNGWIHSADYKSDEHAIPSIYTLVTLIVRKYVPVDDLSTLGNHIQYEDFNNEMIEKQ